jgi:Uri superfamily endonuclease
MPVGNWRLTAAGDGIMLDGKAERIAGVYAYVVDGVVYYVGSAQRGLHTRFRRYVTSQTMRTSIRIRALRRD